MTIKLITPEVIRADVQITIPGVERAGVLKVTYAYQTARQHDAWRAKVLEAAVKSGQQMTDLLAPVIKGWEGLDDDQDKPIPYSVEALDELLDRFPASSTELYHGYTKALTESRVKN